MPHTLGQFLLNETLPEKYRITGPLDKGGMMQKLTGLAQEDPQAYGRIVTQLKRVGDEIITLEGASVGLDDLTPMYKQRDALVRPAIDKIKRTSDPKKREEIILDLQSKMLEQTRGHSSSLAAQAKSGARGSIPQLMKIVASPVAAADERGRMVPWLITHSYAEGLSPGEAWVTGNEARINTIKSATSVAEPGDVSKMLVNTMYGLVVTEDDCGTTNSVSFATNDGQAVGRYLAREAGTHKAGSLLTRQVVSDLQRRGVRLVAVRSPMVCEAEEGVCRKCQGVDEKGGIHQIGVNVGVRAAQALSEPLTQFALNAKHGVRVLKGASKSPAGLPGLRQLLEVPQSFINKAIVATQAGRVTQIEPAPHGGTNVYIGGVRHYVGPNLDVQARVGQTVEAGDALSDGVPKPDEVVRYKGLGTGRQYLVDALHGLYKTQGVDLDRRHLELLARADLNHVKVLEQKHPDLLRGDTVAYNKYRKVAMERTQEVPLDQAVGRVLGKEILHYTVGTEITPSLVSALRAQRITKVPVSMSAPQVEFVMKPLTRNPLLNPDWMARLSHRYLKDSLLKGVHYGEESDLHSTHPIPAYAYGAEFGMGAKGRY